MARDECALAEIHERISQLYASPENLRLVEIAKDDRAPMQSFAAAIGSDPVFVSRLVRLANFIPGLAQKLANIGAAFNALGLDHLTSLALALSTFDLGSAKSIDATDNAPSITLMDLWEHALGSAAIAARIAARTETVSPVSAFVAGFVHDIGKVLLYRYARERFAMATSMAVEKHLPSTQGEILAFGIDHVEAAEEWCRRAELPEPLRRVVRFHHEPLAGLPEAIEDPGERNLVAHVHAADLICEADAIGKGGDRGELSRELRARLNLQGQDWWQQVQWVKREIESARSAFGFLSHAKKLPPLRAAADHKDERAPAARSAPAFSSGPQAASLPVKPAALDVESAPPGKLAILVVEDHSSLCDLLSLYLMRHGYHVRTASNGEGALEVLAKEDIHLILLDLMLPRLDGFEVLREIHKTRPDKPPYIIVVSAGASEKDREKVLEMGANEYMPKPFHLMRLLERVQIVEKYLR
jgi:CheY-like chemotaxis protein